MEKKKALKPIAVNPKTKQQIKKTAKDVAKFTDKTKEMAIEAGQAAKVAVEKGKQDLDLKLLQPIFPESITNEDYTKLIRFVDRDKKYSENPICTNSIGHYSQPKGVQLVNIFNDSIDAFELSFYPDCESEFYYVDPSDKSHYIALDDYFSYLKKARINELQTIAQDLGAKYFKVTYKEEKKTFTKKKANTKLKVKKVAEAEVKHEASEKHYDDFRIAAESRFPGHTPTLPQLHYWEKDSDIQTLIAMRFNDSTPLLHHKLTFEMSHTSGMKINDAVKIDGVLKALKCNGNATLESEAQNESRRYLEYEIEF